MPNGIAKQGGQRGGDSVPWAVSELRAWLPGLSWPSGPPRNYLGEQKDLSHRGYGVDQSLTLSDQEDIDFTMTY